MSPTSETSEWVEKEILIALNAKKRIFPILLAGQNFPIMVNIQFIDARNGQLPPKEFYTQLKRHITSQSSPPPQKQTTLVAQTSSPSKEAEIKTIIQQLAQTRLQEYFIPPSAVIGYVYVYPPTEPLSMSRIANRSTVNTLILQVDADIAGLSLAPLGWNYISYDTKDFPVKPRYRKEVRINLFDPPGLQLQSLVEEIIITNKTLGSSLEQIEITKYEGISKTWEPP